MGTRTLLQRRGKGSPVFKTLKHRFFKPIKYELPSTPLLGQVTRFVDDPAHSTLVAEILLQDGRRIYSIAAEGLAVGDKIGVGVSEFVSIGSILALENIPDGTPVFNIELYPGDGGKLARSSGSNAFVAGRDEETGLVTVKLASKQTVNLLPSCHATVGVACGGGRTEKPFVKAGAKYYAMHARGRYYPIVRGTAMSAYDHPHGGRSLGTPSAVARGAPPGSKTGLLAAKRTGRKKGKIKEVKEKEG